MATTTQITNTDLLFAISIAHQAGELALRHFRQGVAVTIKDDNTPVTRADKECEKLIREAIKKHYPQDSILGEEEGETKNSTSRKWIVDPIDGTYNYARGIPIFATLLALEVDGEIVLGVVHNPCVPETFYAVKGGGAFRNHVPVKVSSTQELSKSHFVFGEPARIQKAGLWGGFSNLIAQTERHRGFGDYLAFALVFDGKADATLEVGVKPWDLATMKILVEEAGGRFSDLSGGQSIYTGSCLVSNKAIHDDCLRVLLDPQAK